MKSFPTIGCDSIATMKTLVAGTDAVSVMPLSTIMAEVVSRQLVVLPLEAPWFHCELGVVRLAHRSLSPIGESFVRMVREEDAKVLEIEKKAVRDLITAPRRPRARPDSKRSG